MTFEILPALKKFNPSFLIISAGFDAHRKDPLGGLSFTDDDFYWVTKELMKVADECCDGKIVSVLEGGYVFASESCALDAIGAQEMLAPILTPAELWEESDRIGAYGPELMRMQDRHDRTFNIERKAKIAGIKRRLADAEAGTGKP